MTTTEPPAVPAPTAPHAHTKKETLVDALKKGKDWAAVLILLLSFGQSVYAAYFKPEKDAHAAYETSKNGLENFSQNVNYSVAELKGRLDVLEKVCLEKHSGPVAMVRPTGVDSPALISLLKGIEPSPAPSEPEAVIVTDDPLSFTEGFKVRLEQRGSGMDDLRIDLPDAPWETQQVK